MCSVVSASRSTYVIADEPQADPQDCIPYHLHIASPSPSCPPSTAIMGARRTRFTASSSFIFRPRSMYHDLVSGRETRGSRSFASGENGMCSIYLRLVFRDSRFDPPSPWRVYFKGICSESQRTHVSFRQTIVFFFFGVGYARDRIAFPSSIGVQLSEVRSRIGLRVVHAFLDRRRQERDAVSPLCGGWISHTCADRSALQKPAFSVLFVFAFLPMRGMGGTRNQPRRQVFGTAVASDHRNKIKRIGERVVGRGRFRTGNDSDWLAARDFSERTFSEFRQSRENLGPVQAYAYIRVQLAPRPARTWLSYISSSATVNRKVNVAFVLENKTHRFHA